MLFCGGWWSAAYTTDFDVAGTFTGETIFDGGGGAHTWFVLGGVSIIEGAGDALLSIFGKEITDDVLSGSMEVPLAGVAMDIPIGSTLTIASDGHLTNSGTIYVNGTLTCTGFLTNDHQRTIN